MDSVKTVSPALLAICLIGNLAGAQEGEAPTADDVAKALANPNTPLASLKFNNQFRGFEGSLPDANGQSSFTMLFQPNFPFALESGASVFWRPAVPLISNQPVFNAATNQFDEQSGLGDIAFDLAYGRTTEDGILWATGIISSLPTATDDLGTDRFTLGPELLYGKLTETYVLGMFPNHQWDIGGSGDVDVSLTTVQLFGTYLPGGGWNVGTTPIITYDWITEQWTVPLNFTVGKTFIFGTTPWKLQLEFNYYVEQADRFGPEWMIGFNFAPVVENVLASWFQ